MNNDENMRAIVVGVKYHGMNYDFDHSMLELKALCEVCGIDPVYTMSQTLDHIVKATYIGTGKIQELKALMDDVDVVVFNEELTPTQLRNLVDLLDKEVLDRTSLILKIFETRAKTSEAKLQVKIAKYQYMLSRLAEMNNDLIGQQGGSGFRGSGEKQIELDRRALRHKLNKAKKDLQQIVLHRQTQRRLRHHNNQKVVALVGYTNSGKSTLMNYFIKHSQVNDKTVFQENMLFATLETSTRQVKLANNKSFLLTDTVGFIHQLPHHLVQAFRSTLEEVKEADLILEVIDSSSKQNKEHVQVTNEVLESLGVNLNKVVYLYNKIDLKQEELIEHHHPYVDISVKENINMDVLMEEIDHYLFGQDHRLSVLLPYEKMSMVSALLDQTHIIKQKHLSDGVYLECECSKKWYEKLKPYKVDKQEFEEEMK